MLLMVAFGALAASLDSYRTTVFGSSSVAGLASIGPSMSQPSEIELDHAAFASATSNLIRIIKPSRLAQRCAHLNPTPHADNNAVKLGGAKHSSRGPHSGPAPLLLGSFRRQQDLASI